MSSAQHRAPTERQMFVGKSYKHVAPPEQRLMPRQTHSYLSATNGSTRVALRAGK